MSASFNLAIPHVVSNQNQKEVTINEAVDALDRALADALDLDLSAGNVALTSAEFRRHLAFRATGLTEDRDLTVPAIKHLFVVINPSGAPTVHIRHGHGRGRARGRVHPLCRRHGRRTACPRRQRER